MVTVPPSATASQRPPSPPPRFPSPFPARSSSPPEASHTALPPSARISIVHVPFPPQSSVTSTLPGLARQRSRLPLHLVLPAFADEFTEPLLSPLGLSAAESSVVEAVSLARCAARRLSLFLFPCFASCASDASAFGSRPKISTSANSTPEASSS